MPLSWYASYHVSARWAVVRHSVGMSVKIEFWSAVATTVPVLGLAQVVQARTIISGWDRSIPAWYRTFQSMLWTATLVGATIAEYFTFIALAGESAPPSWAPALCRYVILALLGNLILSPAFELLSRGPAEIWAHILTSHPLLSFHNKRLKFRTARLLAKGGRTETQARQIISGIDVALSRLSQIEESLQRSDADQYISKDKMKELQAGVNGTRAGLEETKEEVSEDLLKLIIDRQAIAEEDQERSKELQKELKRIRNEYAESLLRYGTGGVLTKEKSAEPPADTQTTETGDRPNGD